MSSKAPSGTASMASIGERSGNAPGAAVFAENIGSRRALEKAGYRQYGLARREEFRHNKWHDMWLAEVLRDEWTG